MFQNVAIFHSPSIKLENIFKMDKVLKIPSNLKDSFNHRNYNSVAFNLVMVVNADDSFFIFLFHTISYV
jgi:hypothetical protein